MLHLHKILDCPVTSWGSCLSLLPKDPSQICFFDIETTGLSAKISQCYLIGAAAVEQKQQLPPAGSLRGSADRPD